MNIRKTKIIATIGPSTASKSIIDKMPKVINMIYKNKFNVIWMCDPMHGNTYQSKTNYKQIKPTSDRKTNRNTIEIWSPNASQKTSKIL